MRPSLLALAARALPIASLLGALALGCSSSSRPDSSGEAHSALARDLSPEPSSSDQTALETGNAAVAFDLYGALRGGQKNVAFSPYSLTSALAMSYVGARGTTASEMATALHFTLPPAQLNPAFDWLDLELASRAEGAPAGTGSTGRPFALHIANSIWGNAGDHYEQPFLDTLAVDYGAGVNLVDFAGNPASATQTINLWVGDQTSGRIPSLLPAGALDSLTRLVLVDALYFDASWSQPFDKNQTGPGTFTRADGSTVQATMMGNYGVMLPYASGSDYQAVELTYQGGLVAMDIVLPAAGSDASFEAALTAGRFASIVSALGTQTMALTLPRFHVTGASVDVAGTLQQLGMHAAFDPASADFSGMFGSRGTYIKNVFHQAFVAVDEDGTEAAAASAVVYEDAGVVLNQVQMVVDSPFFFAIRDLPTGTILFAGRVADPTS